METLQSRSGEIYRTNGIVELFAPAECAEADSGDPSIMESLAAIAEELSIGSIYSMQAITLIATIISVVVLSSTDAWMVFAAAALATVILAVVASAGAYLIAVKTGAVGAHS